jgi:hypothetical protein
MARTTETVLTDDLTGGKAAQTVTFGYDGKTYEIDLNSKNAKELENILSRYVAAGRKLGKAAGKPARSKAATRTKANGATGPKSLIIRAWAKSNGYPNLAARGRIPADVVAAFEANS